MEARNLTRACSGRTRASRRLLKNASVAPRGAPLTRSVMQTRLGRLLRIAVGAAAALILIDLAWSQLMFLGIGTCTLDFVFLKVRDAASHQSPARMSYLYTHECWSPLDLERPWPHNVTEGGSGPFKAGEAMLMPAIGEPLDVTIWAEGYDESHFTFVAPVKLNAPTSWRKAGAHGLEFQAVRRPPTTEDNGK